jgi:hypothetical protein
LGQISAGATTNLGDEQWVKVPENLTKVQNFQVRGNALETIFGKNTNVGLLRPASVFMSFVRLAELQSVVVDTCGESGL